MGHWVGDDDPLPLLLQFPESVVELGELGYA